MERYEVEKPLDPPDPPQCPVLPEPPRFEHCIVISNRCMECGRTLGLSYHVQEGKAKCPACFQNKVAEINERKDAWLEDGA